MKLTDQNQQKTGRPRSEKSHQAILNTAKEMLIKNGLHGMSIEAVASQAGVGKTTIYRRWKTKEDLIAEVLENINNNVEIPDTGSTYEDLLSFTDHMTRSVDSIYGISLPPVVKIMTGIIENPQLMDVYRRHFILPRRNAFLSILERGKRRGEIRQEADSDTIVEMIVGAYFYSSIIFPKETSHSLHETITTIMKGIAVQNLKS